MLMTPLSSFRLAVAVTATLMSQGPSGAEARKAGAQKAQVRTSSPRMTNLKGSGRVQRNAGPKSLTGTGNKKTMLVPAVQKIRDASGGGGGGSKRPKPPEDCMSCAD
jgi:hypothetical protein